MRCRMRSFFEQFGESLNEDEAGGLCFLQNKSMHGWVAIRLFQDLSCSLCHYVSPAKAVLLQLSVVAS